VAVAAISSGPATWSGPPCAGAGPLAARATKRSTSMPVSRGTGLRALRRCPAPSP
jgi:hypothetical protein